MWIDTHCHPFSRPFNEDREAVIQRAQEAGVEKMLVVGYNQEGNRKVLELVKQYDFMWGALGVHPCDCEELTDEEYEWIKSTAANESKIVALGEMGLDYHHMKSSKVVQERVFRKQIQLAKKLDLPCVIHSRDAAEDTLKILLDEGAEKVVFHCYSYDLDFGKKVWSAGYYTSFSGVVTYPQAPDVQEAAKYAPADKILIETDCPYLAPQSVRGQRNEMAYVIEVGKKVAELRGESSDALSEKLLTNTKEVFGF
jgi:TatD DNase family protein